METTYIYPELIGYRSRNREVPPPEYPDTCPSCGAGTVNAQAEYLHGPLYRCGGQYVIKPQIQNHTDYFWGTCPATRAALAIDGAKRALMVFLQDVNISRWLDEHDPQAKQQAREAVADLERIRITSKERGR